MPKPLSSKSQDDTRLVQRFRELAEKIASYYGSHGARLKPYHDASLPHFSRLPADRKAQAVHYLELLEGVISSHLTEAVDATDDTVSLWSALKSYGLRPGSDFFSHLRKEHVIELYNLDHVQIWRNLNFMSFCSYTLEEVNSFTWQELYQRDPQVDAQLWEIARRLFETRSRESVQCTVPFHLLEEKFSEGRFRVEVSHEHFFPLFSKENEFAGFMVVSRCRFDMKQHEPKKNASPAAKKLSLVPDDNSDKN
jgi:hypothetical protein